MLRQIGRLTRPVPVAGRAAHALAVYAEPLAPGERTPSVYRPANEQGFEGVACVDDAARAVVLYCLLWRRWRSRRARTAAHRLLRFLAYMQTEDGRFVNFIFDWGGRQNVRGRTSYPGGPPWQSRAVHALACAVSSFGQAEPEWAERFQRGLIWLDGAVPYLDVRAVGVLAVLEHWRATGDGGSAERALAWSSEIAAHVSQGRLLNAAGDETIHLWGHLQEVALADTGRAFGRADFVDGARASCETLLLPLVQDWFDLERVLPFDVSCTVAGLAALGKATGDQRYARAAAQGRLWFVGRNTARRAVYDGRRGLVYDGIDASRVSQNSGAESNIEGALGLLARA